MLSVFLTVIAFIITVLLRLRPVTSDALGEGLQALGSRHVFGEGLVSLSILVEPPPPILTHTHTHTVPSSIQGHGFELPLGAEPYCWMDSSEKPALLHAWSC